MSVSSSPSGESCQTFQPELGERGDTKPTDASVSGLMSSCSSSRPAAYCALAARGEAEDVEMGEKTEVRGVKGALDASDAEVGVESTEALTASAPTTTYCSCSPDDPVPDCESDERSKLRSGNSKELPPSEPAKVPTRSSSSRTTSSCGVSSGVVDRS